MTYCFRKDVSIAEGVDRIRPELRTKGVRSDVVTLTTVPETRDRVLRKNARVAADSCAAICWAEDKKKRCMAIDRYERVADILEAIAATLDTMRLIERHRGAEIVDNAFTGSTSLLAPEQGWQFIGVSEDATREHIEQESHRLAMEHRPDRGGNGDKMPRIISRSTGCWI